MKRVLFALVPALALLVAAGCDPTNLPSEAKAILMGQAVNTSGSGDLLQTPERLRLMDGSCTGDGNEYQSGDSGGHDGRSGASGQGTTQPLRLRDGSCVQ